MNLVYEFGLIGVILLLLCHIVVSRRILSEMINVYIDKISIQDTQEPPETPEPQECVPHDDLIEVVVSFCKGVNSV